MHLYPAIDLREGRCVRLWQGDYGKETVYGDDPVAQARSFAEAGAHWIHVVDLDAARTGVPENRDIVAAIAQAVDVPVQSGGGVRTEEDALELSDLGVARVVIGTAALEDPDLVASLVGRVAVAVGIDARGDDVAVRGWTEGSGRTPAEVARSFAEVGVSAFVVTEIARDGTLGGPDLEGLAALVAATDVPVVASGGVGSISDLEALAALEVDGRRLSGAILGRALYEGTVELGAALTALGEVEAR
jgi:phosphoribosylformimino-5-aminoimidazole carboxamide ribotide isomerase